MLTSSTTATDTTQQQPTSTTQPPTQPKPLPVAGAPPANPALAASGTNAQPMTQSASTAPSSSTVPPPLSTPDPLAFSAEFDAPTTAQTNATKALTSALPVAGTGSATNPGAQSAQLASNAAQPYNPAAAAGASLSSAYQTFNPQASPSSAVQAAQGALPVAGAPMTPGAASAQLASAASTAPSYQMTPQSPTPIATGGAGISTQGPGPAQTTPPGAAAPAPGQPWTQAEIQAANQAGASDTAYGGGPLQDRTLTSRMPPVPGYGTDVNGYSVLGDTNFASPNGQAVLGYGNATASATGDRQQLMQQIASGTPLTPAQEAEWNQDSAAINQATGASPLSSELSYSGGSGFYPGAPADADAHNTAVAAAAPRSNVSGFTIGANGQATPTYSTLPSGALNPNGAYTINGLDVNGMGQPIQGGYNALSDYYRQAGTTPGAMNPTTTAMIESNPALLSGLTPVEQAGVMAQLNGTSVGGGGPGSSVSPGYLSSLTSPFTMASPASAGGNGAGAPSGPLAPPGVSARPVPYSPTTNAPSGPGTQGPGPAQTGTPGTAANGGNTNQPFLPIAQNQPTDSNGMPTSGNPSTSTSGNPNNPSQGPGGVSLTPTTPSTALTNSTISVGALTNPLDLAQQAYQTFRQQTDPQYEADLRDANRYAAAGGAIGSGALNTSLGNIANQRQNTLNTEEQGLITAALGQENANAYQNVGIAEQQQGFQAGQQQTAFNQAAQTQELAQSAQGQQFQQYMQSLGFNSAQIQQAFNQAMQEYYAGNINNPMAYLEYISAHYNTPAGSTGFGGTAG